MEIKTLNHFEKLLKKDRVIPRVTLNDELIYQLLEDISDGFDDLEKIIYLYIKMCKHFSYVDEYYVLHMYEQKRIKKTPEMIKNINSNVNTVVCYEFIAILAKMVDCFFNVDFQIEPFSKNWYDKRHVSLLLSFKEFVIRLDPFSPFFKGDVINAKYNFPLKGITDLTGEETIIKKLSQKISKVYSYIIERENVNKKINFKHFDNNEGDFINDLINLIEAVLSMEGENLDIIGYLIHNKNNLFNKESSNLIDMIALRDNKPTNKNKIATTSLLIVYNEMGLDDESNEYLLFNTQKSFICYTKGEIKEKLENNELENIFFSNIPGLNNVSKSRRKKLIS